jgi:hypothetical protein
LIHLDAAFLIDLHRETVRGRPGGALDFIEGLDEDETLGVSVHAVAEMRAGVELSKRALQEGEEVDRLLSRVVIAYPDGRFVGYDRYDIPVVPYRARGSKEGPQTRDHRRRRDRTRCRRSVNSCA